MSKVVTAKEICAMPKDQEGYVSLWAEIKPLDNSASQVFAGFVDANTLFDYFFLRETVNFYTKEVHSSFPQGARIRFWDSCPTEQERETTPWEVEDHE